MNKITEKSLSIGVVTYLARFEDYFKPLIKKLYSIFPDYDIIVFLNGHHNQEKQIHFLQNVTSFLTKYPNVRYLTNVTHQPLARSWNWLILMAMRENILILNDDLMVNTEIRHNLEKLSSPPNIFIINRSWSHFVINKKIVRQVGWFDERLSGIGYEDYDYIFRLARQGITVKSIALHGIFNYVAPSTDASWATISEVTAGKYSKVNYEFFLKKWAWSKYEDVSEKKAFRVIYEPHDQEWLVALKEPASFAEAYLPMVSLAYSNCPTTGVFPRIRGKFAKVRSLINSLFWTARLTVTAYLRRKGLLGTWWEKVKARFER